MVGERIINIRLKKGRLLSKGSCRYRMKMYLYMIYDITENVFPLIWRGGEKSRKSKVRVLINFLINFKLVDGWN